MWIYWKEQCKYCVNQNCGYKEDVKILTDKLIKLDKESKNIYGTLKFTCDYFVVDEEKYRRENAADVVE